MFKNKTVLITGANGGIGRALVETLEKKNVNLVCLIRKKNKNFLDFIKNKKKVKIITCDLTNEKKLSTQITSFPSTTRRLHRWEPIKPAPPVTKTFFCPIFIDSFLKSKNFLEL